MRLAMTALLIAASLVIVPRAQTNSDAWRTYGGNVQGWRYSELTQIDVRNVARLTPRWIYQIGVGRGFETTPLVFDGLWALLFVDTDLYFTAGIADEEHGLFGEIEANE